MTHDEIRKAAEFAIELVRDATPGWRAGRADMQSYTIGGIPFKNLYNDAIAKDREGAVVYGENSIADSQLFEFSSSKLGNLARAALDLVEENERLERRLCELPCGACGENFFKHHENCLETEDCEAHEWETKTQPGGPWGPAERFTVCKHCGMEKSDG